MVFRTQRYAGQIARNLPSGASRFAAAQLKPIFKSLLIPALVLSPFVLTFACGGESAKPPAGLDDNHDGLADDLGAFVDANKDRQVDMFDINGDGKVDGPAVDKTGGTTPNSIPLDLDCDGTYDSLDTNGDGLADLQTGRIKVTPPADCKPANPIGGGGAPGTGGAPGMAGSSPGGSAGAAPTAGTGATTTQLGKGMYQGSGDTTGRYAEGDVYRNGVGYMFIANGWGTNWQDHSISWQGTSYTVKSLNGTQGSDYSPAGYPTMFCGLYSKKPSDCALPMAITTAKSIKTGWRWKANGNTGQYNAAWDIWLGNNGNLSSYLMVWLRDPKGQQPAGGAKTAGATVPGLPGTWNIWTGNVNNLPIVNYVLPEGQDIGELEYDVLDVYNDAIKRGYSLPGAQILAVAVGFEIWNGPVTNLVTEDFYVDVK